MKSPHRPTARRRVVPPSAQTETPSEAPGSFWGSPSLGSPDAELDEGWWDFGKIGRPHGVRGGVHLHLENPDGEALAAGMQVRLELSGRGYRLAQIEDIYGPNLVRFAGVGDRDAAATLRGAQVAVHRDDFPPPADDEAYLVDLIGAEVHHVDGRMLGTIASFDTGGPQILATVQMAGPAGARETEIPFVPGLVVGIDDTEGVVTVDPPWGLFEGEPDEA